MVEPPNSHEDPSQYSDSIGDTNAIGSLVVPPAIGIELRRAAWYRRIPVRKILLFFLSIYLFILAISLLKHGAQGMSYLVRDSFMVKNSANSLGFGWLFAYVIMSGSPVAAVSLTFFDAGVIDNFGAFSMITGSRLGASFIVLFIGFIYVLRGRDKSTSLSMGLLSLVVTATTYLPGLVVGFFLLRYGTFDNVQMSSGAILQSVIDIVIDPIIMLAGSILPNWLVFVTGVAVIIISLNLFDKCLPQMSLKESQFGWMSRLVYRPVVMFALGALVTLVSMSVSVSLGLLVPLSSRGFVRRENVVPYIMGANITTFVDTLFAAVLLNNPPAFTIVLVEMISITVVSFVILIFFYRAYQIWMLRFVGALTSYPLALGAFMVVIFVIPVLLLLL